MFSTHSSHYITLDDISFYSEEFRIGSKKSESKSRTAKAEHNVGANNDDDGVDRDEEEENSSALDPFASAISSFSPDNEMFYSQSALTDNESKSRELDDSDDDEEGEEIYRSEMILMGCMNSRQEIRINMKLAENIDGPKVSLEVTFGSILLFFTPRQFHMLLLLCDILLNGEGSTTNNSADDGKKSNSKMQSEEMKKFHSYGGNLLNHQTWSGEDYDCSSEITSANRMHSLRPGGGDSILSSNSSMTSSMQSSASQTTTHSNRHRRAIERDQNADISHYNIRIAGIYILLSHDDILVPEVESNIYHPLNESTVEKLKCRCERFFNYTTSFMNTCSTSDLMKIGAIFNKACDINHLR